MTRPPTALAPLLAGLAIAAASAPSRAEAPSIAEIRPAGVQRGVATAVTIRGEGLDGNPRLVSPFDAEVVPSGEGRESDAKGWRFRLTVPAGTPVGAYPVRVRTDDGISNPVLIAVGQVPQVPEEEPNDSKDRAQAVAPPCVVDGRAEGNDVDFFRFPGREGERIVIDAQCARIGSGLDPTLRLTTASGRFVASDDDSPGLLTDARLVVELPEDGDYLIELSDSQYRGADRPSYRLLIGPVPVADEVFPLGGRRGETVGLELRGGTLTGVVVAAATLDSPEGEAAFRPRIPGSAIGPDVPLDIELPQPLAVGRRPELREPADPAAPPLRVAPPATINGRLEPEGDEDRYVVLVEPGATYRAWVEAATLGSAIDGVLRVLGPGGEQIAEGDDTTIELSRGGERNAPAINSPDPSAEFEVPEGAAEVTLVLRDLSSRGGVGHPYRLTVERAEPRFEVELLATEVSVPRGGAANVPIHAARLGYDGPITLAVSGLPDGLTARAGTIPAGQAAGVISLLAGIDAELDPGAPLIVTGTGEGPDGPIVAEAGTMVTYATLGNFPTNIRPQRGLPAASARPTPITLGTPSDPVELVRGYGAEVPIAVSRSEAEGSGAALEVEPLPLPGGLSAAKATLDEGASEGEVTVEAAADAPIGPATVAFTAKGKLGEADRSFAVPAVTVEVVAPAALALACPGVEVEAGGSVEVSGTLSRKGPFAEEVTIALEGLPDGLAADPVTLAGDAAEFTLTITASPDAAAGKADARASAAFKLKDADYPTLSAPLAVEVAAKEEP